MTGIWDKLKGIFSPPNVVKKPCVHDFNEYDPKIVVCAPNDLDKLYNFRVCRKCKRVEVWHGAGFWKEAETQLVMPSDQWVELKNDRRKEKIKYSPAYQGTSGKYRSIDDAD